MERKVLGINPYTNPHLKEKLVKKYGKKWEEKMGFNKKAVSYKEKALNKAK